MIAHFVLFQPRADLTVAEREGLTSAFAEAVREIPSIGRVRVGRRITHGRGYEALMRVDYSHVAVFEFDDLAGLMAYLQHPAHEALATRFFEAFEVALMYDFELVDGANLDLLTP